MKRVPAPKPSLVSCFAVVRRTGGFVLLRLELNAGVVTIKHSALDALAVADAIREAVAFAVAHAHPTVELGLPSGESLLLSVAHAARAADELTTGASRATGVRA